MATPQRIFCIYSQLQRNAEEVRDFQQANGEKVSGTVNLLCAGDALKPLTRWGEEMMEMLGVIEGTHDDSYLMEATQTFYWASLYAALSAATWAELEFATGRVQAGTAFASTNELRSAVERLVSLGTAAKPGKLFMLWNAADWFYRRQTPADHQWSLEQILEADYQDILKRPYLQPLLKLCPH